jgi:polyhydroxyalkanoate synthase
MMTATTGTKRREIHREGTLRLYRYEGARGAARPPVVLVYSFINRATVLDLQKGRSVVESLLAAGLDVYLVDWGDPKRAEAELDLAGHASRLERAVRAAARTAGSEKASLLGYCLGGTMALVLGALAPDLVDRIALLATPVVFAQGGTLATWAQIPTLDPAHLALSPEGNVPGELLREVFKWLDPMGQVRKWVTLAERYEDEDWRESFVAQERWANDCVDFPGILYAEMMTKLYREDLFAKGELKVGERTLALGQVVAPVLSVIAEGDRIVPNESSLPLETLAKNVRTVKVPGGHIGMTVGKRAPKTTHAELTRFLSS